MFVDLFFKECKQIARSLTYFLIISLIVIFYFTQFNVDPIIEPQPGLDNYGTRYGGDENTIMAETLKRLENEYASNSYIAYPIGFYKQVTLKEEKQNKIKEILESASNSNISYKQFVTLMEQADKIIGGGTNYAEELLYKNAMVPITYEDALTEYNSILKDDKITNASARLFSDYMGIILAILPVFLAVTRCLRDKRAYADGVIYAKRASSFSIILSRYTSIVAMILLPLIIIAIFPTLQCNYLGNALNIKVDNFSFYKYIFGWILPTILVSTSVGFFVTEFTNSALAILVQGAWWFVSIFMSASNLVGNVGMNLIPRFNRQGGYDIYIKIFDELVINRISYTILAMILIFASVFIYEAKRNGKWGKNGKIFKNKQSQL